jgi:ABC-type nitrate/sulfonate/bicarbonate transport system substrate-binding protein
MPNSIFSFKAVKFAALIFAPATLAGHACAADKVRVGKSVAIAWTFTPLDIGKEMGIWAKHGIDLDISSFGGDAKLQQAMAADGVDFGLGSGPGMGFAVKGVPAKAVAAFAGAPYNLGIVVAANSPYTDIKQMKGKKFAITTVGSLTDWLLKRVALSEGWKHDDLIGVPLGGFETNYAAFKTGQVDGIVLAIESCYLLVNRGEAKIIARMGDYAPQFHTHVIYARNEVIEKNPDLVKRFLDAWFETIAWMKANKEKTVEISARVLKSTPDIISRAYDEQIKMLQDNGKFNPAAIKVIKESLIEMDILDKQPTDEQLFTTQFVGK